MTTRIVDPTLPPGPNIYATIQAAVSAASPFDLIKVNLGFGFYAENVVVSTPNIKIVATVPGIVILDGSSIPSPSGTGFTLAATANNTIIDGFVIQNYDLGIQIDSNNCMVNNSLINNISQFSGIEINGTYNEIRNNLIQSIALSSGIRINPSSNNNKIILNIIQSIAVLCGIEIWGDSNNIRKNSIDTDNNHVVYIGGFFGGGINNIIKNNKMKVPASNYSGVYNFANTQSNTIAYNQIYITPGSMGIRINQSTNDVVHNNILS